MKKNFLISGIGPSDTGVGRLMSKLVPNAKSEGYKILIYEGGISLRSLIYKKKYLSFFCEVIKKYLRKVYFHLIINFIYDSNVVYVFPQSAGLGVIFRLIKNRNKIFYYVMDNSFFCIRSYNVNPIDETECFKCLREKIEPEVNCQPFPVWAKKEQLIDEMINFRKISDKVIFLAQNNNQAALLKSFFGQVIIHVVGLDTGELALFNSSISNNQRVLLSHSKKIVFHASTHIAKGITFFLDLAKIIPEIVFIIPDSRENVEKIIGANVRLTNVVFKPCRWETGLNELVKSADIVLNPSLWSAPIEGALLKSLFFNPNVATVATQRGYEEELYSTTQHLRLNRDYHKAGKQLREYLKKMNLNGTKYTVYPSKESLLPKDYSSIFDIVRRYSN